MSEWFFARLLRLYPREFQRVYGADALQLIRDRSRDERSVLLQLRLCLDIVADLLVVSLQNRSPAKPLVLSDNTSGGRTPLLLLHQSSSPRPPALAAGMVTSTVMFALFTQMFYPLAPDDLGARVLISSLFHTTPAQSNGSATQSTDVNSANRHKLIETVTANLKQHYFDAAMGRQLAAALLDHDRKGDYDSLALGADFAARINTHIQDASRALGISAGAFVADVVYSTRPIPHGPPPLSAEALKRNRSTLLQQDCLFEKSRCCRTTLVI